MEPLIEICKHRYGKQMTYTEQTDGVHYEDSYPWIRSLLKERGLKAGIFASLGDLKSRKIYEVKEDVENGIFGVDVYSSLLPSVLDKVMHRHRRISESEWNDFYDYQIMPAYFRVFGRFPIAVSYAYGNDKFKKAVTQFLGGRNSGVGAGYMYDENVLNNSRPSTFRWYDEFVRGGGYNADSQIDKMQDAIEGALHESGWINNFTHWHNVVSDHREKDYEKYFDMLYEMNRKYDIHFCSYGEALSYCAFRTMITGTSILPCIDNQGRQHSILKLEIDTKKERNPFLLQVPISLKVSFQESRPVSCNYPLKQLSDKEVIIEVPYSSSPIIDIYSH